MNTKYAFYLICFVVSLLHFSCQVIKKNEIKTSHHVIEPIYADSLVLVASNTGFSPLSEKENREMLFFLKFTGKKNIGKWSFRVFDLRGKVYKEINRGNADIPDSIKWDAVVESGLYAPEGLYTAELVVCFTNSCSESISRKVTFYLDTSLPEGSLDFNPSHYSSSNGNFLFITYIPDSERTRTVSWLVEIFDTYGNLILSEMNMWPLNTVMWDGHGSDGKVVSIAEDYPLVVRILDEYGSVGMIHTNIPVDISIIKDKDKYRIENSRIYFQENTIDYENISLYLSRQNILRLDRLAEKLKYFSDYKILIIGHASIVDADRNFHSDITIQQMQALLAKARAEAIKRALVTRGVLPGQIHTAGATENEFENRHVTIYLEE